MDHSSRAPRSRCTAIPATLAVVATLLLLTGRAGAQAPTDAARAVRRAIVSPAERRSLVAVRASSAPVIDGRLDDAAWSAASVGLDFVQRAPDVLKPATQRTEVRLLIDDAAVYVAMRLFDSAPDSIVAPLARRDADPYSDWAEVSIDGYLDRRTAFRFMVNPAGVQRDAVVSGDDLFTEDIGWDAVWASATRRDSAGWTAELRIPLSQLRFSVRDGVSRWGLQVGRFLARRNERSYWSPITPSLPGYVSQFGTLDDVTIARQVRRAELLPYMSTKMTRAPAEAGNPFARATALQRTAGVDLRLGVTQDLTLTGTINPDFGQVEADPSEVNLTGVESFFAERRPFFLEGSDLFAFDMGSLWWMGREELFYSRRLGRSPQGDAPDGSSWLTSPAAASVLGAAKLTGRTATGWKLAALGALTDDVQARYVSDGGELASSVIEPRTRYGVARVTRELDGGGSSFGSALTFVDRDETVPTLRSSALVGGIDARTRFGGRNFIAYGNVMRSVVRGSPEAMIATQRSTTHLFQRPDASYLEVDSGRTSLTGTSASLRITKEGGGHVRGGLLAKAITPGFEANDVGLQPRADAIGGALWLGWDGFEPTRLVRSWSTWAAAWGGSSFGGDRDQLGARLYASADLHNYWALAGAVVRNAPVTSLTALRGGPALQIPGNVFGFVDVTTDSRRPIVGTFGASGYRDDAGPGRRLSLTSTISARVGGNTQLSVAPSLSWWRNPQQFVAESTLGDSTHYVVGDLLQSTAAIMLRASYALSSRLTLQLYAQPFLSAGEYRGLGTVANARANTFDQRVRLFAPDALGRPSADELEARTPSGTLRFDRPDYSVAELNANAVLRWEYRPGSALFVVWSQGRSYDGEPSQFDMSAQTRDLLRAPATNVLLVKVSHWVGR
jgi:Domain of unknown function (DUF5916)/Carbohydrate family 9 binding domain-like